jgi:hypothetical protein
MDESVSCSTGSVLTPMPKKSDVEQTVELLSKIVDEVKLDEKLPKPGEVQIYYFKQNYQFCNHSWQCAA